jgi:excisionase family DNA binding protein
MMEGGTRLMESVQKTTMSVPEMRELLGLKKTESYWLVHKNYFQTVTIGGEMRVVISSFEKWYENQVHYKKVNGPAPGEKLRKSSYSVKDISQLLGIEDSSIYDLLEREDIETITVDHQKRVKRSVFEEWYSNQSHYRTQQDREADLELERQSMSLPEMARALGIDRNDAYHLADTVRDLIIIKVAEKRRVLTDSFEKWYSNQSTFKKLEDRSEAEIRQIQMKTRDQILKRKIAESLQGVKLTKGRYTIKEAAKIFKISESAVQRMIRSGGLKAVRLKNTWYIVRDDIEYLRTLNSTRMQREEDQNGFVD